MAVLPMTLSKRQWMDSSNERHLHEITNLGLYTFFNIIIKANCFLLCVKHLVQYLPPTRSICTAHCARNRTVLISPFKLTFPSYSLLFISSLNHTCIPSVIAHHSLIFGFARMSSISFSKSVPTYLNVAKRVRSLSKKIESSLIRRKDVN